VTTVLKSIALAFVGAGLFFGFFMMFSIPVLTVMAKLHGTDAPLRAPGVIVAPAFLFRAIGLPLSGVAFVVSFVLALKRFRSRKGGHSRLPAAQSSSQPPAISR